MMYLGEGTHRARVIDVTMDQTRTGTDYLAIHWQSPGGEYAQSKHWLTERAWPYTEKLLREVFAWDAQRNGYALDKLVGDTSPLLDIEADLVIEEEEGDNGKTFSNVKWVNKPGQGKRKNLRPAEARAFSDRLRQRLGMGPANGSGKSRKPGKLTEAVEMAAEVAAADGVPF